MVTQDFHDIATALSKATGLTIELTEKLLVRPKSLEHGDWAFPSFSLSKEWKVSPPEAAKRIESSLELPSSVDRAEVVGPYLNFFIKRAPFAEAVIGSILKEGADVGLKRSNGKTLLIEYSSPNIAKTIHVGHLRTTLIGLSLERISKHLGFNVITVNHLGDWGTQFGYVWAGAELWGRPENPGVDELVDLYIKATNLRKAQETGTVDPGDMEKPNVTEMARDYFRRLEGGEATAVQFWQWCLDISMTYLKRIYERLGIHFDHYTGESFYKDMVPQIEEFVRKSGILEDSRGALGVDLGKELGFVRIFTEDGRSLYITRDIAAAMYRHDTFKPEKNIYVVAAQQSLHFKQLIAIFERMGHPAAKEMVHVPFGFVPGMKTREGGAISLDSFLNEAFERALIAYREEVEKKPEGLNDKEIAEKVAIGSTYFYFLSHSNVKDFNFSWKEALNFQGDTGPYVQYALARLNSIKQKAEESGVSTATKGIGEYLVDEDAHEITTLLSQFNETVEKSATEYEPYYIASYILDVAKTFSKAYKRLRVVGEEKNIASARLSLFVATQHVLRKGMTLIGMPPIERM